MMLAPEGERVVALQATIGLRPAGWRELTWRYEQCTFVSVAVTCRRLGQWLKGGERTIALGDARATIAFTPNAQYTRTHIPSLARYHDMQLAWPSFFHEPSIASSANFNAPSGNLVGAGDTPSFPAFSAAFNAFFYDQWAVTGSSNPDLTRARIHVVDNRARIQRIRLRPGSVEVWLSGRALTDTVVELNSAEHRSTLKVTRQHLVFPHADGLLSDAWIWVKAGQDWLDLRPLSAWGGVVSPDIEMDFPRDVSAELDQLATRGEGPFLEYKQQLPETNDQKRKVFKTAVAFANGSGGTLLFGIEDETQRIKGITGNPVDERRRLTDFVRDLIAPSPRFTVDAADVRGHQLLALHIQPGDGTIHALRVAHNKPEYYVRRDASTYYAQPGEMQAIAALNTASPTRAAPWIRPRRYRQ
jgi:hypothetical protein